MTAPAAERTRADLDADSLTFEQAAEARVTGQLDVAVSIANQAIKAQYERLKAKHGVPLPRREGEALARYAAQLLSGIDPDMQPELAREVQRGLRMGADQAREISGERTRGNRLADRDLRRVTRQVDQRARAALDDAVAYAQTGPLSRMEDVQVVMNAAQRAATRARADVRWATNRAINAGASAVADAQGRHLVWIAERDACLHCLAYSGVVTAAGELFPEGLTFAASSGLPAVPYPPLHPNCRCRVEPFNDDVGTDTGLQREARRAVLRGDSAYASERERLSAADRLLRRGAGLPRTVEERARRAVRAGRFETEAERTARRRS